MSLIFGILSLSGDPVPCDWITAVECRAGTWPSDHRAHFSSARSYLGIHELTPATGHGQVGFAVAQDGLTCAVVDGRIDNKEELQRQLGLPKSDHATLVLAAFSRWGPDFGSRFVGEFALATMNARSDTLTLVRDAMGTLPLFTARGGGYFAFASVMSVLMDLPFVDAAINDAWITDFLEIIKPDASSTPYRGIAAVAPAEQITISPHGMRRAQIWAPPPAGALEGITPEDAITEFRRLFDQAVRCRLPPSGAVACELSGGLDSTSIAVTAAPIMASRGDEMLTLSHVLADGGAPFAGLADERRQIEAVLAIMPQGRHRWLTESQSSQINAMSDAIARHGGLQRRDFNSVQHGMAQALRENQCRVLLSGFGGDQLATSPGHGWAESLAQDARWDELARSGIRTRRLLMWRSALGRQVLRVRARRAFDVRCRRVPRLTRAEWMSDDEIASRRIAYPLRPYWGTIGERERDVICSPHIGHRGQDSGVGAGSLGFIYSYPMLDLRLVDFCLRLPDRLKRGPAGERRVLIRAAMEGRLPDIVRLRDDKSPAAVPAAVASFYAEAEQFIALFERHRCNPAVVSMVDLERAAVQMQDFTASRGQSEGIRVRQFRRLAELCLWHEWLSGRQPNQAE